MTKKIDKKKKLSPMEELTKNHEEFEKRNEVKPITKKEFHDNLDRLIKSKK
jgi:hypothetical protein